MSNVEKWPQRHLLCLGSERYVLLSPRSCQLFLVRSDASHVQRHSDVFQVGMLILHCSPDVVGNRDIDIATATEIPYADAIGKPPKSFRTQGIRCAETGPSERKAVHEIRLLIVRIPQLHNRLRRSRRPTNNEL